MKIFHVHSSEKERADLIARLGNLAHYWVEHRVGFPDKPLVEAIKVKPYDDFFDEF
jgi:hypothetical protein